MSNRLIAVIPARGGSKRIPDKNIYPLLGKPLLAYTIESALESGVAERVVVSTDSEKIAQIALRFGAEVVARPDTLSHDTASTEEALLHAVDTMSGCDSGFVLTLQATSPLRTAETIRAFVRFYWQNCGAIDSLISLHENRGDFWTQAEDGHFQRLYPDAPRRTQDRTPLFEENSALYLNRIAILKKTSSVIGGRISGFVIDPVDAIDINTIEDMVLAEQHLRLRQSDR